MKIFLDIGHPAHVHYFKNVIHALKDKGWGFTITARDKEMTHYLLDTENIPYISRGKGGNGIFGKIVYMGKADHQLYSIAKREQPDLFMSFGSPYCSQVAWLMGKPCITIDDTETAALGQMLYRPFTTTILTPMAFRKNLGKKQVRFPSYIELSYLHPKYFKPDLNIFDELEIDPGEKYSILRFVKLSANHDMGIKESSLKFKKKAIEAFSKFGHVFISSESELPVELNQYRLKTDPKKIHHVLAFASLLYGESGTMSSEAAVLGTPAVFINRYANSLGTISEQENKYGLTHTFSDDDEERRKSIAKGVEILKADRKDYLEKRNALLQDNVDFSSYLEKYILKVVENIN